MFLNKTVECSIEDIRSQNKSSNGKLEYLKLYSGIIQYEHHMSVFRRRIQYLLNKTIKSIILFLMNLWLIMKKSRYKK